MGLLFASAFRSSRAGNRGVYQGELYAGERNITGWAPVVATSGLQWSPMITIDVNNVRRYYTLVIKSFADRQTEQFYVSGRSRHVPPGLRRVAMRKLFQLEYARDINDLVSPPGNRLETLKGDHEGQYSIRINDQYRLCFEFKGGDAYNVEIVDYH